jgi:hypothetical protein
VRTFEKGIGADFSSREHEARKSKFINNKSLMFRIEFEKIKIGRLLVIISNQI